MDSMMVMQPTMPQSPLAKRPREDDETQLSTPTRPTIAASPMSSNLSTPMSLPPIPEFERSSPGNLLQGSPAPSTSTSLSVENARAAQSSSAPAASSAAPPAKRRRLNPQEKLEQEREKQRKASEREEKQRQKEIEAQQKAEEKRKKAEEKEIAKREKDLELQKKEEEKLEKRQAKEAEKQRKEELQRQKEEALEKKDSNQMRLGNFFNIRGVKSTPAPLHRTKSGGSKQSPSKPHYITKDEARRKSMSIEPAEVDDELYSEDVKIEPDVQPVEKQKWYMPFHVHDNLAMPAPRASTSEEYLQTLQILEDSLNGIHTDIQPNSAFSADAARPRGFATLSVRELMEQLEDETSQNVDSTNGFSAQGNTLQALRATPLKYLHFSRDVRPPYCGTRTQVPHLAKMRSLGRRPYQRAVEQLDYDYDSEAEWVEPEEGEDLGSEGEEDDDDDEDDEMDEFIDKDDAPARRLLNAKELEVVSSGICWEDAKGRTIPSGDTKPALDLSDFALEFLLEGVKSIDPFSTSYWDKVVTKTPSKKDATLPAGQTRLPLGITSAATTNKQATLTGTPAPIAKLQKADKPAKQIRLVGPEDLDNFKAAIRDRTETKAALVPILQKQFSKYPKDVIAATLSHVASRNTIHKCWFLLEMPAQVTPTQTAD